MCSNICQSDLEDTCRGKEPNEHTFGSKTSCRKCSDEASIVLRKKDPLCRSCFLAYCTHKFRATIGKSHQVKPGHRVLVAFSGGASSTVLLHMIKEGLAEETHKRFLFKPFLLFVDESPYPGWSATETAEFHKEVVQIMLSSGHYCYISSINMMFKECDKTPYLQVKSKEEADLFFQNDTEKYKLNQCIQDIQTLSYREDFLRHMRWNIIKEVAGCENMDKIFSGESCTLLATQLLTSMSLGRGSQVAQDTAFADSVKGIPILRPLREFQSKEIAMYNHFHSLKYLIHPTLATKVAQCSSLHQVTEAFIAELQTEFPATVSTIFRTGDKLSAFVPTSEIPCLMCHAHIDTELPESSAVAALKLSAELSKLQCETSEEKHCPKSPDDSCNCRERNMHLEDIPLLLCYACQRIFQNMTSKTLLPSEFFQKAQDIIKRKKMHDSIKDFLLEDCG